jgi:hypothetical protein
MNEHEGDECRYCKGYVEEGQDFCSVECADNYDPAPYCSYGHKTAKACDCGPIAKND